MCPQVFLNRFKKSWTWQGWSCFVCLATRGGAWYAHIMYICNWLLLKTKKTDSCTSDLPHMNTSHFTNPLGRGGDGALFQTIILIKGLSKCTLSIFFPGCEHRPLIKAFLYASLIPSCFSKMTKKHTLLPSLHVFARNHVRTYIAWSWKQL